MTNDKNICIIAGMPRAATTFLYHTLQQHPTAFVTARKETDFFSVNFYRGVDWYLSFFCDMREDQVGFDISPMYFLDDDSPSRIYAFNGRMKIILIIRDPIQWIVSFYKHMQAKSFRKIDFQNFILHYIYKKDNKKLYLSFPLHFIEKRIKNFCNQFGENLLLCDYSVLKEAPLSLVKAVEKFAGLPDYFTKNNFKEKVINASDQEPAKIVNILMQNKLFADLIVKIIPKKLILRTRESLQTSNQKKKDNSGKNFVKEDHIEYVKNLYQEDQKYILSMFKKDSFILGNGNPFEFAN
jgi:hypothetical protein